VSFDSLEKKLISYYEHSQNVLFIGTHGVGKTSVFKSVINELNVNGKYYSASTLDPWAHIIGIPVPNKEKSLDFLRPQDINNAEIVFFDELNRAHPRTLNAVLEMVQFRAINGEPLPRLKCVWAAINPPDGTYQVEDLDPALVDRFHVYINMAPVLNEDYLKTKMDADVFRILSDWWTNDLSADQRRVVTPRRIEYLGYMISKDLPYLDGFPLGMDFNKKSLMMKLEAYKSGGFSDLIYNITIDDILNRKEEILEKLKDNAGIGLKLVKHIREMHSDEIFKVRDIVESLPKEQVFECVSRHLNSYLRMVKDHFVSNKIDFVKYPKIYEAFRFDEV